MLTFDGKEFRNLQEQVLKNKEDIARHYEVDRVLSNFGIKIVGQVDTADELPDPLTYTGEYGDAYAVGAEGDYTFYIFTRPNENTGSTDNQWLDVGGLTIVGPQGPQGETGPQGPKGDRGSLWISTRNIPNASTAEIGDQLLYTLEGANNGNVYSCEYQPDGITKTWAYKGNIRGPQGVQGIQGIQGPQGETGPQGPKGDRGDVGGFINIWGIVANVGQLPTPSSLDNLSVAYLVGASAPYDLYIQVGETSSEATWNNTGLFNAATLVQVNGVGQNVWDADTKLDKQENKYSGLSAAYVVKPDGTNGILAIADGGPRAYVLPYYGSKDSVGIDRVFENTGYISTCEPVAKSHATTKNYVDTNFLAKPEYSQSGISSSQTYETVPIVLSDGTVSKDVATFQNIANGIVRRTAAGTILSNNPTQPQEVTTKAYVDNAVKFYNHEIKIANEAGDYMVITVMSRDANAYTSVSEIPYIPKYGFLTIPSSAIPYTGIVKIGAENPSQVIICTSIPDTNNYGITPSTITDTPNPI